MEVLYRLSYRGIFRLCGGGRIRTSVGEAGRFTVCSLWPLGHTPGHAPAALCAERPNMVANATDFSTDEKGCRDLQGEPGKGFEPPTGRLQGGCSTSELPGRGAAGGTPQAAAPACQHAPACGLHSQPASGLRPSLSASSPARTRNCNSANPALTSPLVLAESGARRGVLTRREAPC
jgi:hypothetical protein